MSAESRRTTPLRAILLGGLLLTAGGIAVWNALGSGPSGEPNPPAKEAQDPGAQTASAEPQKLAAIEAAARKEGTDARQPLSPPDATTSRAPLRIKVTCWLADTKRPAARAKVFYLDAQFDYSDLSPEEKAESERLTFDRESWLERFGKLELSDSNGVAYLTIPKTGSPPVCARLGDLFGITYISMTQEPPKGGYKILLEKDLDFYCQTVDARRQPVANVPLTLRYMRYHRDYMDQLSEHVRGVGATDSEGRLHVRHMQTALVRVRNQDGSLPFRVCLHIPGHHREGADLALDRLPTEPVMLIVPPTGQVEVCLVDRLGSAMPAQRPIDLYVDGETSYVTTKDNVRHPPSRWSERPKGDQPAVFRLVGLGQKLVARYSRDPRYSGDVRESNHVFAGPTRAGETVKATITLGGGAPVLVGRALGADGEPLIRRRLTLYVYWGDPSIPANHKAITDGPGLFRAQLRRMPRPMQVTKVRLDLLDDNLQPVGIGTVRSLVNAAAKGGKIDLGDVVLTETPLLLKGQLAGKGDLSEKTVHLVVQRRDRDAAAGRLFESGVTILRQDGNRFEVRGHPATSSLQILAFSEKHLPVEPVPFAPGDKDVVIRLWQGGSIQARVRLGHQSLGMLGLTIQMIPIDPRTRSKADSDPYRTHGRYGFLAHSEDDTILQYTWASLWPGRYRLEVNVFGSVTPVHVVEDIVIEEGKPTKDDRLETIDLRRKVLCVRLRCLDASGGPIQRVSGRAMAQLLENGRPTGDAFAINGGLAILVGARASFDVKVLVPGYKPKTVLEIKEHIDVRLEPGLRVRFRLQPAPPRFADDTVLAVSLVSDLGKLLGCKPGLIMDPAAWTGPLGTKLRYRTFSTTGELSLGVPAPGHYPVILHLRRKPRGEWDERSMGTPITGVTPAYVVVKDSPDEQVFELQVPAASWKKAGIGR